MAAGAKAPRSARKELSSWIDRLLARLTRWIEPPLGWSPSARGRKDMDEHLDRQRIKFQCFQGLLTGAGCPKEPPCPARC